MPLIAVLLAAMLALTACGGSIVERLAQENYAPEAFAEAWYVRCVGGTSLDDRMKTWAAAQKHLDTYHPGVTLFIGDCPPQDGVPDFTVDDVIAAGHYTPPK